MKKQTNPDWVESWTFEAIRTFADAATEGTLRPCRKHLSAKPTSCAVMATTAAPHFGSAGQWRLPTRLADQPGKPVKFFPRETLREASRTWR